MSSTTPIASNTTTTATTTNNNITYTPESLFDLAFTEALKAILNPTYDPNDTEQRKKIVAKSVKKMLNLLASDSVPARASSALTSSSSPGFVMYANASKNDKKYYFISKSAHRHPSLTISHQRTMSQRQATITTTQSALSALIKSSVRSAMIHLKLAPDNVVYPDFVAYSAAIDVTQQFRRAPASGEGQPPAAEQVDATKLYLHYLATAKEYCDAVCEITDPAKLGTMVVKLTGDVLAEFGLKPQE
ncbi:hypothetical protein LTR95_016948 [Oleoguttula sp. CCFEE 5521]